MNQRHHWDHVYESKATDRLGWHTPHLRISTDWTESIGLSPASPIVDIGGGASTYVDDLLEAGYRSITVLDISQQALTTVQKRLGRRSDLVSWLSEDITTADLPDQGYELWHDRALFHFLTEAEDRDAYLRNLLAALRPNGHVIFGVFAHEAPPTCSGLPVRRYNEQELANEVGSAFSLVQHAKELHITPGGVEQMYQYCQFLRSA